MGAQMPFDLGDWKPERPNKPNINPDPALPVTGRWWRFLCRIGWHYRCIHPRNIWVDDEGPHAWSKCVGCGEVRKL